MKMRLQIGYGNLINYGFRVLSRAVFACFQYSRIRHEMGAKIPVAKKIRLFMLLCECNHFVADKYSACSIHFLTKNCYRSQQFSLSFAIDHQI